MGKVDSEVYILFLMNKLSKLIEALSYLKQKKIPFKYNILGFLENISCEEAISRIELEIKSLENEIEKFKFI